MSDYGPEIVERLAEKWQTGMTFTRPQKVRYGSKPCQNASLGRSESREVGDARGMFRSDYALIAAISG